MGSVKAKINKNEFLCATKMKKGKIVFFTKCGALPK